jgi:hypothetical protein
MMAPTERDALAGPSLSGQVPSPSEALAVLASPDEELLAVLLAAFQQLRRHSGHDARIHVQRNPNGSSARRNVPAASGR